MTCHIEKVKHGDLVACIRSITHLGGRLLSVTRSDALMNEQLGIRQPAYVVIYEYDEEITWETLC